MRQPAREETEHEHGQGDHHGLNQRHRGGQLGARREPRLDDRGRHDLAVRAHQQDRRAKLAHAGDEDQQPGGKKAGFEQRRRDRAHAVGPGGAAYLPALVQALVELQDDAADGAHAQRHEDGEIGDQQYPERAVERQREHEPGPHHAEREHEPRHGLREHGQVLERAAARQPAAQNDPRQQARDHDAERRRHHAEDHAVEHGRANGIDRERLGEIDEREVGGRRERDGESLNRGEEQGGDGQDRGQEHIERDDAEQGPPQPPHVHHARAEGLARHGHVALARGQPAIEPQHGEHDREQRHAHRCRQRNARRILRDEVIDRGRDDIEARRRAEHERDRERPQHLGEHEDARRRARPARRAAASRATWSASGLRP